MLRVTKEMMAGRAEESDVIFDVRECIVKFLWFEVKGASVWLV